MRFECAAATLQSHATQLIQPSHCQRLARRYRQDNEALAPVALFAARRRAHNARARAVALLEREAGQSAHDGLHLIVIGRPVHHDRHQRAQRGKGLGRVLSTGAGELAVQSGVEKLVAHMTPDQIGAVTVFETMGFRAEALLRDHVRDAEGSKHDLVILSLDVDRFRARAAAYGLVGNEP